MLHFQVELVRNNFKFEAPIPWYSSHTNNHLYIIYQSIMEMLTYFHRMLLNKNCGCMIFSVAYPYRKSMSIIERVGIIFLPLSWRHAHAHFGFAHRQQPLRWLKPCLKHWYVKLYELIAPHTLKWVNSVIKLGHFVWNIIYCLSRIKFKDRWVVFFIYDSFCWTKSPTAAGLGSRNDAM